MVWFKVDDSFFGHPKRLSVSMSALGLWTVAGSWCGRHQTSGRVPESALKLLGGTEKQADELVSAGLWDVFGSGWKFHDWTDYQPPLDSKEVQRRNGRERTQRWREKKKGDAAVTVTVTSQGDGVTGAPEPEPETEPLTTNVSHLKPRSSSSRTSQTRNVLGEERS